MIKMVVSDMDGTLLSRKVGISSGNLEAIRELEQRGIESLLRQDGIIKACIPFWMITI